MAPPGAARVDLSWTPLAGAASYRIYRSTDGCEDQWFEIGETVVYGVAIVDGRIVVRTGRELICLENSR